MNLLDRRDTEHPEDGVQRMCLYLRDMGCLGPNAKRVRRLLRQMGLEAFYPKPRLGIPDPVTGRYPYLLKGLEITRPDQVWYADITYMGLPEGFGYRLLQHVRARQPYSLCVQESNGWQPQLVALIC
jgi:putative transposase